MQQRDIAYSIRRKVGEAITLRMRESFGTPPSDVGYDLTNIAITSSLVIAGTSTPAASWTVTKGPSQSVPATAGWYDLDVARDALEVGRYFFDVRFSPADLKDWKTKTYELVITESQTP